MRPEQHRNAGEIRPRDRRCSRHLPGLHRTRPRSKECPHVKRRLRGVVGRIAPCRAGVPGEASSAETPYTGGMLDMRNTSIDVVAARGERADGTGGKAWALDATLARTPRARHAGEGRDVREMRLRPGTRATGRKSGCTSGPMGEGYTGAARCAHRMNGSQGGPPNGKCAAPPRVCARRETIRRLHRSRAFGAPSFASSEAAKTGHIPGPALPTRRSVPAQASSPKRGTASSGTG